MIRQSTIKQKIKELGGEYDVIKDIITFDKYKIKGFYKLIKQYQLNVQAYGLSTHLYNILDLEEAIKAIPDTTGKVHLFYINKNKDTITLKHI